MWSLVDPALGEQREEELRKEDSFFGSALERGARMVRHDGTRECAVGILREVLGCGATESGGKEDAGEGLVLDIQRELVDEGKNLQQTAAAEEIERELNEQKKRQQEEAERLKKELEGKKSLLDI